MLRCENSSMWINNFRPKRYKLNDLVDWFFMLMRMDAEWGYWRYDMRYDPIFQIRVSLTDALSPAYPIGFLHWEGIERVI